MTYTYWMRARTCEREQFGLQSHAQYAELIAVRDYVMVHSMVPVLVRGQVQYCYTMHAQYRFMCSILQTVSYLWYITLRFRAQCPDQ